MRRAVERIVAAFVPGPVRRRETVHRARVPSRASSVARGVLGNAENAAPIEAARLRRDDDVELEVTSP
jgi:hypothetical protein